MLNKENIVIKKKSKLYRSKSWPNENFPEFINFVILVETSLNLKKLFLKIKNIESKVGRIKSKRNFPRVCDIDIIDFNSRIIQKKIGNNKINLPHERMHKRNFVLLPLFEINKIIGRIHEDGLTVVPTKMYFKKGKAKLEIAVAKGKKQFDKRLTKKTRDWNREKARYIRKSS